jgi:hypothetical protein
MNSPVALVSDLYTPWAIVLSDTSVFWTNDLAGTVMSVGLDGGIPVTLARGQPNPGLIAIQGPQVFWVDQKGTVMKMLVDGGSLEQLAPPTTNYPVAITTDDSFVYWSVSGAILKAPLTGGQAITLTPNSAGATAEAIVVYGNSLYWADNGDNSVKKLTPK